jgi:hypothetical protein
MSSKLGTVSVVKEVAVVAAVAVESAVVSAGAR